MDKLTAIRIKYDDGTYSEEIPVSALAEDIIWNSSHNLVDILGEVDLTKGNIQQQLNEKFNSDDISTYVDTQISTDVTAWLNEHVNPVGSAVVVDNSLTTAGAAADAKKVGDELGTLNERLEDLEDGGPYAPIIHVVGQKAKYTDFSKYGAISGTVSDASVTGLGLSKMVAYNGDNLLGNLSEYEVYQEWSQGSVSLSDDHLTLNGVYARRIFLSKNGSVEIPLPEPIPANTPYCFGAIIKGTSSGQVVSTCAVQMPMLDENKTQIRGGTAYIYNDTDWMITGRTLARPAYYTQIIIVGNEEWECDNLEVYPFVFLTDKYIRSDTIINEGEKYDLDIRGWDKLSTAPYTHTVSYYADTKTYIDNHAPEDYISTKNLPQYISHLVERSELEDYARIEELHFLTPEMFGAKGDYYSADDTEALQACIDEGTKRTDGRNIPVRGYGAYTTSSPLRIAGYYLDIFIKSIRYTGSDAAVVVSGKNSTFEFDEIIASTSGAVGLRVLSAPDANVRYTGFDSNVLTVNQRIYADGNGVELIRTADATESIMYNTFRLHKINSLNGNCIYADSAGAFTENIFYGQATSAPNGYLYYSTSRYTHDVELHDFCIENNVKNGVYGGAHLYSCRTIECMNHYTQEEPDRGRIFVLGNTIPNVYADDYTDVALLAVDASNAMSWNDFVEAVKDRYDEGGVTVHQAFRSITEGSGPWFNVLGACHMTCESGFAGSTAFQPNGHVIHYFKHIAFKPDKDIYSKISATPHVIKLEATRVSAQQYFTPTIFDIDIADCSIYLDWSYCAVAIDKFKVIQYDDKKATVYDKFGNVIFDGASHPAGVYSFECVKTNIPNPLIVMRDGAELNYEDFWGRMLYNGENEEWHVYRMGDLVH